MTFNTAIYDVHPGDRRQLERIFGKEADARLAGGLTLYSESFGSPGSMLVAPMKFDLFIVDGATAAECPDGSVNVEVAYRIRESGAIAPVLLLFEEGIPLPSCSVPEGVMLHNKPITTAFIRSTLDRFIGEKAKMPVRYEIRGNKETFYVSPDEVLYAFTAGRSADVYMTEGRSAHLVEGMSYLKSIFEHEPCMKRIGRNTMVNLHHIKKTGIACLIMSDGKRIPCGPAELIICHATLRSGSATTGHGR